jgi:competence protein ComEC
VNPLIAAVLWAGSFLLSDPQESQIKLNYPEIELIQYFRERFLLSLNGVSSDAEGLVAGLTIGERSLLSSEVAEEMKMLSLTHLVAVSGANLAIVIGAVYFLLAGLGLSRNLRYLFALCVMSFYVLLVGPESSVIRAATMALFVMIGLWLGRGSTPLNSLALAIIFLLAVDPGLSKDIGFALSAFATAGLLLLAPPVFEWLRTYLHDFLALGVAASFSAQLFTMPVLLILQPSIPVYSVLANLIVEPVVAPITILGIAGVLVAGVNIPIAGALSFLASLLASWIVWVAEELSVWPLARVHFVQGLAGIGLVSLFVLLIALSLGVGKKYSTHMQLAALLVLIVAVSWSTNDVVRYRTFAGDFSVMACDVGQGDALLIRDQSRIALIDVGKDDELIDKCLAQARVTHIDLLVLTHFDADHVGGIRGALKNRSVGTAIISGYKDDRPLVKVVQDELSRANVSIELGRKGLSGTLGSFDWQVLQPSKIDEGQDSNDASVVVSFRNQEHGILALGDLGASGQQRLLRSSMSELNKLRAQTLVLKVAHHGSADQSEELFRYLQADFAIFSVGKNDYGHPTTRSLALARNHGATILRTDQHGPIALGLDKEVKVFLAGKLSA